MSLKKVLGGNLELWIKILKNIIPNEYPFPDLGASWRITCAASGRRSTRKPWPPRESRSVLGPKDRTCLECIPYLDCRSRNSIVYLWNRFKSRHVETPDEYETSSVKCAPHYLNVWIAVTGEKRICAICSNHIFVHGTLYVTIENFFLGDRQSFPSKINEQK